MRNIVYILVLVVVFILSLAGRHSSVYTPVPEGTLYNINASSRTLASEDITAAPLFSTGAGMPVFQAYTDLQLPGRFIVSLTPNRDDASFILSSPSRLASVRQLDAPQAGSAVAASHVRPYSAGGTGGTAQPRPVSANTAARPAVKSVQTEKQTFSSLNKQITASSKTFFFSNSVKEISDVKVKVLSMTPWQDKAILKFQIANQGTQYFFIASAALFDGSRPVPAELFHDPMVPSERTAECIALMPRSNAGPLTLKVIESGGKNRTFAVTFTAP